MFTTNPMMNPKSEKFECLGFIALKAAALVAGLAIFVPLLAGFAAPFIG